jgi:streptomycin 6-kinase
LPDGTEVVLKLQYPHRESEHEAAALELWDGRGAIRLLAHDPERHALLLERCRPGTPLWDLDQDSALDVMVGLFPRLWSPAAGPFTPLEQEAQWWIDHLLHRRERMGSAPERRLLDAALDVLHDLAPTQGEQVLLSQDQHSGNVLKAEREPWLVIDPKPLTGEREFGIAALVRDGELGEGPRELHYRLDRLTAELGLDRTRARRWGLGQTVAWSFEDDEVLPVMLERASWLLQSL